MRVIRKISSGNISHGKVVLLAVSPGITLASSYLILGIFLQEINLNLAFFIIQPIPSIMQYLIFRTVIEDSRNEPYNPSAREYIITRITSVKITITLIGIIVFSGIIGILRDNISGGPGKYSVFILLSLKYAHLCIVVIFKRK